MTVLPASRGMLPVMFGGGGELRHVSFRENKVTRILMCNAR